MLRAAGRRSKRTDDPDDIDHRRYEERGIAEERKRGQIEQRKKSRSGRFR
jgi:hypothetical protein